MQQAPFVWLGSRRAKKRGVSEKGYLLDLAANAGLPVPKGGILLDEAYQLLLRERVIIEEDGRVAIPDPGFLRHTLFEAIRFPQLDGLAAVRPAFSEQSFFNFEGAEPLPAVAGIDLGEPAQLAESLAHAWSAALQRESTAKGAVERIRRDLIIMEMVAAERSGVAISRRTTDHVLASANTPGEHGSLSLPVLRMWQRPPKGLPLFAQRLQRLLRGIRRTFGASNWWIRWAHDGDVCWLLTLLPALPVDGDLET